MLVSKSNLKKKTFHTRLPQKWQGPEPSCSHTIRPQLRQLLTSLCFWARHSQICRPGSTTDSLSCPSLLYRLINLFFFFVEKVLSWIWKPVKREKQEWNEINNWQTSHIIIAVLKLQKSPPRMESKRREWFSDGALTLLSSTGVLTASGSASI